MSRKERRKIYLEAAIFFSLPFMKRKGACGFCDYCSHNDLGVDEFKEYELFNPNPNEYFPFFYWFEYTTQDDRILALLFAAEMCNDK